MAETDELDDLELTDEERERRRAAAAPAAGATGAIGKPLPLVGGNNAPAGTPSALAGTSTPPPTGAVGVFPNPETENRPIGGELTPPAAPSIGTPLTPPAQPHARPNYNEYERLLNTPAAVTQKHGLGGALLKGLDIAGSIVAPGQMTLVPGTRLHHIAEVNRAARAAGTENQEITGESEEALRAAETERQTAEAEKANRTPPVKQGLTPEEMTLHDLMTGDNGNPRINPATGKPYTYLEAYQDVQQARQDVKPQKQNPTEVIKRKVNGIDHNILVDKTTGKDIQDLGELGEKAPTEPGNYLPVPDPADPIHKIIGWVDPKSGHFRSLADIKPLAGGGAAPQLGAVKPSGQEASREGQAEVVTRAGNDLINEIQTHRGKLGNMQAIIESALLGTPWSDPETSGLRAQIASFAALNPAMHGFRGTDALREFEKLLGGVPNNPDSMIAGIKGILRTASAFKPTEGGGGHNFTYNGQRYENVPDELYNKYKGKPGFQE